MRIFRYAVFVCSTFSPLACATEQAQLAQALRQIELLQDTLRRAQTEADQQGSQRYFFDYAAASQDLNTLRNGIQRYLSPARAQPRTSDDISGNYRRERR